MVSKMVTKKQKSFVREDSQKAVINNLTGCLKTGHFYSIITSISIDIGHPVNLLRRDSLNNELVVNLQVFVSKKTEYN